MFNLRWGARFLSTVSKHHQRKGQAESYPFSKTAIIPPVPHIAPALALHEGRGVMEYLNKTLPPLDKQKMLTRLFSRHSVDCLRPGSIVTIVSDVAPTSFTGVLLAIRRRGMSTSFTVRNIINRTGVEMQYFPVSPHVLDIKLVRPPPEGRMRRAKLFYLRDSPQKMSMIAGVTK